MSQGLPRTNLRPMSLSSIQGFSPLGVARIIVGFFSRLDGERAPPAENKTKHVRLVTIGISPFCEKARWGLDLLEQDLQNPYYYTENAHPPAFHGFETLPLTDGKTSLTPILVYPSGKYIVESHNILSEMCPFLNPPEIAGEIRKFELEMADRLASTIRCICYYYLLDENKKYYKFYSELVCRFTSKVETILFDKMLDKGLAKALQKVLGWNEEANRKSIQEVRLVLKEISERLEANGGEYIFDTPQKKYGFTAADLTFAAFANLLIRPSELSCCYSADDESCPPELVKLMKSFAVTKAGQHCQKIYKLHRPVSPDDGKVHIRSANRDRNPFRENAAYWVGAAGAAALSIGAAVYLWTDRRK